MARGRIVSNEIARDKKVNALSCDTSRLAFTWLITFADAEGKTHGDPAIVRSMIFPRRVDVTIEDMEKFIKEWDAAGLIIWYEAAGDMWISLPNFDKHQPNLRKDREAKSIIPDPPIIQQPPETTPKDIDTHPALLLSTSGVMPDEIPVKLTEDKLTHAPTGASEKPGIVKNAGAYKALEGYEARKARGDPDVSWLPEHLRPLGEAFISAADIYPLKSEHARWQKDLGMFYDSAILPAVIPKAVNKMRNDGITIKTPASLFGVARDISAKGSSDRGEVFWEVH